MYHESVRTIRRFTFFCLLCVVVFLFVATATSTKSATSEITAEPPIINPPKNLTTNTWGIFDVETGEVLSGENIEAAYPIASVTKLFTAYIAEKSEHEDEVFMITQADIATEGRAGKLTYGDQTTPYKLLYPLLLESSNDAAEAIRRFLGSSYNTELATILSTHNLTHTTLDDASGLSPNNISTVDDLAHFYASVRTETPHILDITQLHSYVGDTVTYANNNPGRDFDTFTGGKQGYTPEAEHTFAGTFKLDDTGKEIGVVILQSTDLRSDIRSLLSYSEGFVAASAIIGK